METLPSTPLPNGDNGLPAEARDSKGRFLPGNKGGPGNPQAGSVHAWRKALADVISPDDVAEVIRRLIEAAKAGEPWAVHEVLDRCLGKPTVSIDVGESEEAVARYERRRAEDLRIVTALVMAEAEKQA